MISIVQLTVVAYIGYALLLLVFQRALLFPGTGRVPDRAADATLPSHLLRTWHEVTGGRVEAWLIRHALETNSGRRAATARLLGITRTTWMARS